MKQVEKRKQTFKNNPDIMKRSIERRRQTYKNNPDIMKRSHEKQKQTYKNHPEIIKESIKKTILTKRKNNTFNTSKSEDELYTLLKQKYPDIKRNYNSDRRYPYMCDFYIPSKDLFIELQASWTHGSAPFKNTDDQQFILNEWKQKSLKSNFYKNAIEVWTTRDVKKRQVAKSNKLNYIEVWTCDFKELYENNIL